MGYCRTLCSLPITTISFSRYILSSSNLCIVYVFFVCHTGLPTTKLSDFIEVRVNNFLKKEGAAPNVTIRVVSVCDKQVEVKPAMNMR